MPPFLHSLTLFGVMEFLGDFYPGYIANDRCFAVLGCNVGLGGYDGLMHFVSGVCVGLGLLWAKRRGWRYPRAMSAWTFLVWSLCIAVAWELAEWSVDLYRTYLLSMDLYAPVNISVQPSGIDTIGDIVLACAGTLVVYLVYLVWRTPRTSDAQVAGVS